jgi:hypothetical protein
MNGPDRQQRSDYSLRAGQDGTIVVETNPSDKG